MSFELLPHLTGLVLAISAVVLLGLLVLVGEVTSVLLANRSIRIARHQTIRHYYGNLAHSH